MTDISKELEIWRNAKKGKDVRAAQIALSEKLNNGKLENNLGEENAGKALVIGPDGTVGPGEVGGGPGGGGSYTLPQATENALGGVKAADKGPDDTVPAKIGDDGKLYVPKYPTSLPASDVKDWAKAEEKPKYTAAEVGALSNETKIPEKLPNPNKLIFTGAVEKEYDGSDEVTINIPNGESGGETQNLFWKPTVSEEGEISWAQDSSTVPPDPQNIKGPKGDPGAKGDPGQTGATPNIQIGQVTTLDPGQSATANIMGTQENPILNLGIPKGEKGEEASSEIDVQQMQNTDTTVTLQPNILYLFPEMTTLDVTIPKTNQEVHFFFDSGQTATVFSLKVQDGTPIYTDTYSIDANMRYEVSVLHNVAYIKGVSISVET